MTNGSKASYGIRRRHAARRLAPAVVVALIVSSCLPLNEAPEEVLARVDGRTSWPSGDPKSGKELFVSKGCFICHSANGVGGRAALPLDAPPDGREIDPMVFAAAMWEGASAMISLQFTELGYQIGMTGDELRDLAAFASDPKVQAAFSLDDIPEDLRPWIIDAPHWLEEDWPKTFETPPDGLTPPFEDL